MKNLTIDGRRFEQDERGLYIPKDSTESIDELEWFHRFWREIQTVVLNEKSPGIVLPVEIHAFQYREMFGDGLISQLNEETFIWDALGQAETGWHFDTNRVEGAGPRQRREYRPSSFILMNTEQGAKHRSTFIVDQKNAQRAIRNCLEDMDPEAKAKFTPYSQDYEWTPGRQQTSIRRTRGFCHEKRALKEAIDNAGFQIVWDNHPKTAILINNEIYLHRGEYKSHGVHPLGTLYRAIIP